MTKKSLNTNYRSEKLVFFNKMDHEVQNEESMIQKSKVVVSMILDYSINVFAQSSNVWAQSPDLLTRSIKNIDTLNKCINTVSKKGIGRMTWSGYS